MSTWHRRTLDGLKEFLPTKVITVSGVEIGCARTSKFGFTATERLSGLAVEQGWPTRRECLDQATQRVARMDARHWPGYTREIAAAVPRVLAAKGLDWPLAWLEWDDLCRAVLAEVTAAHAAEVNL